MINVKNTPSKQSSHTKTVLNQNLDKKALQSNTNSNNSKKQKAPHKIQLPVIDHTIELISLDKNSYEIKLNVLQVANAEKNSTFVLNLQKPKQLNISFGLLINDEKKSYIPLDNGFPGVTINRVEENIHVELPILLQNTNTLLVFIKNEVYFMQIGINNNLRGFIEKYDQGLLYGWVYDESHPNEPIEININVGDQLVGNCNASIYRGDLEEAGFGNGQHGFSVKIDSLSETNTNKYPVSLKLKNNAQVISTNFFKIEQIESKPTSLKLLSNIEKLDNFVVQGWAVLGSSAPKSLIVKIDNQETMCPVVWSNRSDVADKLKTETKKVGFEVQLPGYIWENIDDDKALAMFLFADGQPLNIKAIELTKNKVIEWIETVVTGLSNQNDQEKQNQIQYLALVALEHVKYGSLNNLLKHESLICLQQFAAQMNLEGFFSANKQTIHQPFIENSFVELYHWKALNILNERIGLKKASDDVFTIVTQVIDDLGLKDDVKARYLGSVIPLLCQHNTFSRLREISDFNHWHDCDKIDDAWCITISLPFLVYDQKISRAINALWKLSKHLHIGWVNTECIHTALKEFNRQVIEGHIEASSHEKFYYAVIGVLDAFEGNWFSRSHDIELIRTAISLVEVFDYHTDYFQHDLISALIRNYALVPDFWTILDEKHPDFNNIELKNAHKHWEQIRSIIQNSDPLHEQLNLLEPSLRYFRGMKNHETTIFLREVLINSLPYVQQDLLSSHYSMLEMLLEDKKESIRLAAYPFSEINNLAALFPGSFGRLQENLCQLSEQPKSPYFQTQIKAGKLVQKLADSNNPKIWATTLNEIRKFTNVFDNEGTLFISVDLLIWTQILANQKGIDQVCDLQIVSATLQKVVWETNVDCFLPAPVLSGLARLKEHSDKYPYIKSVLSEIEQHIQTKFSSQYENLFLTPSSQIEIEPSVFAADTLVVIYSCQKYLDSRIPAIRETWIKDLQSRGIPYLILVGDGDDKINGDILALNVSDKYEDLPKKTLKLFDWLLLNTEFQYVYKIDDDCYLNVAQFFDSLTYRKHHYYGRIIERSLGSMDRTWHQPKSQSIYAQKTIDKSPEPACYADGGGGYVLSRFAMVNLNKVSQTETGQRLIAASLMEDKLVGDLLAMCRILPSNEDYHSYQRRRTYAEATPVGMWENIFFPNFNTPTMMSHLDTDKDMGWVHKNSESYELWPKKLLPTFSSLENFGMNQLELLVNSKKLKQLLEKPIYLISVIRNELTLLPHFLKHYRKLGVESFLIVDNLSDDGSREYLLQQDDVALFSTDTEYKDSQYGVAWQQALLGNFCINKWVLVADADEFLVGPDSNTMVEIVEQLSKEGADCVRINMIDMYPFGKLNEADFEQHNPFDVSAYFDKNPLKAWHLGTGFFSNSETYLSNLRHRLCSNSEPDAFTSQKFALFRYAPWMRLSQGVHFQSGMKVAEESIYFAHFKYHSGFEKKIKSEIQRGQHFDNAKEYRRYATMLEEGKGYFGDKDLSVLYKNALSFSPKITE